MVDERLASTSDTKILSLCLLLLAGIFGFDTFLPLGIAGGVPYILVVLVALWSKRINLPLYMALAGSVLTVVGIFLSPPGGEFAKIFTNRFLALFAIWTTAILCVQRRRIGDEKEKALQQVRVLKGLLTICASCKKIRDDSGHWNQMEYYIQAHSDAQFSHGICPDCAIRLYPDIGVCPEKDNG